MSCTKINKHDLRIRPIYHWTAQRIKAHIAIAFIAFVCVRYLEYRMAVQSQKLSAEVIRNSLMNVHATVIQDKKLEKTFFLPSKFNSHAKEIYRILRIKIPAKMMAINCSA